MHAVRSSRLSRPRSNGQISWDSPLGSFLIRSLFVHSPRNAPSPTLAHAPASTFSNTPSQKFLHSISHTPARPLRSRPGQSRCYHVAPTLSKQSQAHPSPVNSQEGTQPAPAVEGSKRLIGSFLTPPNTETQFNPYETIADSLGQDTGTFTTMSVSPPKMATPLSPTNMMNEAITTKNARQVWHTYSRLRGTGAEPKYSGYSGSLYFRILRAFQSSRAVAASKWARTVYEDMLWYHVPKIQSLNTLLDIMVRHEDIDWAIDYFTKQTQKLELKPNTRSYNIMIRGLVANDRIETAKQIYNDMRTDPLKDHPDVVTYSTFMGHYVRQGQHQEADQILDEMFKDKIVPNQWIFNIAVKRLVDKKDYNGAWKVLTLMRESNMKPDVVTYSTLIDGYAEDGNEEAISKIQEEMANHRIYPSEKTVNSSIKVFSRTDLDGEIDTRLEAVLKSLPTGEMSDNTFGVLMDVYGKRKDMDLALGVYRHVLSRGRPVSDHIVNSLLDGYVRSGQVPTANRIFHEHFTRRDVHPITTWTYSIMIAGCCKESNLADALYYYNEMISRNIEPSAIAYSRMIQLYLEHDQPENANQMFRRMRSNKMTVSVQTFTMLMEYMSKANDTRAALRYYQEMLDAGVQPDVNCYTTLINVQLRGKNVAGAERAYENMMKAGVSPTIYTYMSMMRVYSLQGHLDKVKGQWEAMAEAGIVPDLKAYTLLMQSYGQTGNAEMAEFIYKMMTQKDVVPDIITFTSLLGAYANLPHLSVSRVEEITRTVKDMELDPTPEYFKLLFDMYGRHRMPDKVIRTWNEFQKLSKPLEWVPTTSNSLHLIEACRERGYIDTLHVVWQRITTGRQKNNDDSSNGGIDGDGSGDSIGVGDGGVTNSLPPDVKIMPEVFSAYLNTLLTHNRFGEIEKLLQTECKELQIVPRTQDFELLFTGLAQFGFLENELKSVRGVVIGAWPSVQPLVDNIISNTRKI